MGSVHAHEQILGSELLIVTYTGPCKGNMDGLILEDMYHKL